MKLIVAIIRPELLSCVEAALKRFEVHSLAFTETHSYGQGEGHNLIYRSSEIRVRTSPRLRLEIIVDSFDGEEVADAIADSCVLPRSRFTSECKVFVMPLDHFVDVSEGANAALPARSR
jgi:nitrogen regulatory protein PII